MARSVQCMFADKGLDKCNFLTSDDPAIGTSSSPVIFADTVAALDHFDALVTLTQGSVQNIRPRKNGVAFREPFGAKSIHWA